MGNLPKALVCLAFAGCATPSNTWEASAREGLSTATTRARPPPPSPKKTVTIETKDPDTPDYQALSRNLELSIIRFTSKRRALSKALERSTTWPKPMRALWTETLSILGKGYQTPPGSLARRLLIQTRVSLDVELDLTERRFGPAPESIKKKTRKIWTRVAMHLRAKPLVAERRKNPVPIRLIWPLSPVIVTSPFGYRRDPILGEQRIRFHSGVDLGGDKNDVVLAAAAGRVTYAGWLGGHGRTVVVQHAGGFVTMYAHLRRVLVDFGDEVRGGASIGLVGNTGRSTGPHLHFEVRHGGTPIDPLDAVGVVIARVGR